MKNLENFGVQEMNANEMEKVNGGFLGIIVLAFVTGFLWTLASD